MTKTVLIRGVGDVGSAVAHVLYRAGFAVAINDGPCPTTSRRGMAFTDAVFDGSATLEDVMAQRIDSLDDLEAAALSREFIPVTIVPIEPVVAMGWAVLVDARMRKRALPEDQRGLVELTIGLGPNFVAGGNVDVAIETHWEGLGQVIRTGPTRPLEGEPRSIDGVGRQRFVYAPASGSFRTTAKLGDVVTAGEVVSHVDAVPLAAPIDGIVLAVTRDGVAVERGTKVLEIDPRGNPSAAFKIGERPRRLGEAVLSVIVGAPVRS